jgi:hypothetical protein
MCKAHLVICWYNDVGFGSGGGAPPKAVAVKERCDEHRGGQGRGARNRGNSIELAMQLDAPLFSNEI